MFEPSIIYKSRCYRSPGDLKETAGKVQVESQTRYHVTVKERDNHERLTTTGSDKREGKSTSFELDRSEFLARTKAWSCTMCSVMDVALSSPCCLQDVLCSAQTAASFPQVLKYCRQLQSTSSLSMCFWVALLPQHSRACACQCCCGAVLRRAALSATSSTSIEPYIPKDLHLSNRPDTSENTYALTGRAQIEMSAPL